jgi:hypothetical protein
MFYISALSSTPIGSYILKSTIIDGNFDKVYTNPPPLYINVVSTPCQLTTPNSTYNIPVGGYSIPIVTDFFNCLPVSDIKLSITITPANTVLTLVSEFTHDTIYYASSIENYTLFKIREFSASLYSLPATYTLTFSLLGADY